MELTIRFKQSKSQNFSLALEMAKTHPSFREFEEFKIKWHEVSCTEKDFEFLFQLMPIIVGWKGTQIRVDGLLRPNYCVKFLIECAYESWPQCRKTIRAQWCGYCPLEANRKPPPTIEEEMQEELNRLICEIEGKEF